MKTFYTLILIAFSWFNLKAQLSFSPDTACIHLDTLGVIDTLHLTITNNGSNEELFFCKLDVGKNFPTQWKTQICDFNLCYAYNAKQQSPNQPNRLAPGVTNKSFSFYLIDSFNYVFLDTVYINIYKDKTFTQLIKTIPIIIGGCTQTSATHEELLSNFSIFPNPITERFFNVVSNKEYEYVTIKDLVGKPIAKMVKSETEQYPLEGLPPGLYLVQLVDKNGKSKYHSAKLLVL